LTEPTPPVGLDETGTAARRRVVSLLTAFVFAGTFASIVWHYINAQYWMKGYPSSTFLVVPRWRISDFFDVYRDAQSLGSAGQQNLAYSPVLHLFTKAITALPLKLALGLIVAAFLSTLAAVVWTRLTPDLGTALERLPHALVLTFFAYPVLFAVDRGNLEMVVFVLLAAFFYLYFAVHSRWAWLPLALAIAAKYYWATLLVLPLLDKQYRQTVYADAGGGGGGPGGGGRAPPPPPPPPPPSPGPPAWASARCSRYGAARSKVTSTCR
jgi:hypothetical protein